MTNLRAELQSLIDDPAAFVDDDRVELRRLAVALLGKAGAGAMATLSGTLRHDAEGSVRAAAAEALAAMGDPAPLLDATTDDDPNVREAIAFSLGEIGDSAAVDWLVEAASTDGEDAVREAAVAALGAIGDERCLPLLIELATSAPPKVRRRTVVALSAFEDDGALAAIRVALGDRNPMVKEVAEMVVGSGSEDLPWPKKRSS